MRGGLTVSIFSLLVLLSVGAAPANAAGPAISVTVNGNSVSDGGSTTVQSNPDLGIEITADQPIESVFVRVDGTTVRSYSPNSTSFSKQFTLELSSGSQTVEVIASSSSTQTISFTVTKDDQRPQVSYSSPFETDRHSPPDSVSVSSTQITLAGTLHDHSAIDYVRVRSSYEFEYAGEEETHEIQFQIQDPGDSFSRELFLGTGENQLTVRVVDQFGNVRVHRTVVDVQDTTRPQVNLTYPQRTERSRITLRGTISDNSQLDSVRLNQDGGSVSLLSPTGPRPDQTRQSITVEREIDLQPGKNSYKLVATDLDGNSVTEEITIRYERTVAPEISFDRENTTLVGSDRIALHAAVERGETTGVTVESVDSDGQVVDIARVYEGDARERIRVTQELALSNGTTTVRIIATDSNGGRHNQSITIDPAAGEIDFTPGSSPNTSSSPMPDGGATTAPATTEAATPQPTDAPSTTVDTETSTAIQPPAQTDSDGTPDGTAFDFTLPVPGSGLGGVGVLDLALGVWVVAVGTTALTRVTPVHAGLGKFLATGAVLATIVGSVLDFNPVKLGLAVVLFIAWAVAIPDSDTTVQGPQAQQTKTTNTSSGASSGTPSGGGFSGQSGHQGDTDVFRGQNDSNRDDTEVFERNSGGETEVFDGDSDDETDVYDSGDPGR